MAFGVEQVLDAPGTLDEKALAADLKAAGRGDYSFKKTKGFWYGKAIQEIFLSLTKLEADAQQQVAQESIQALSQSLGIHLQLEATEGQSVLQTLAQALQGVISTDLQVQGAAAQEEIGLESSAQEGVAEAVNTFGWLAQWAIEVHEFLVAGDFGGLPDWLMEWAGKQIEQAKDYDATLNNAKTIERPDSATQSQVEAGIGYDGFDYKKTGAGARSEFLKSGRAGLVGAIRGAVDRTLARRGYTTDGAIAGSPAAGGTTTGSGGGTHFDPRGP